jgi:hypothetical protein
MHKIYQTIVEKGKGNCMQAAIASLFDLTLDEVPNFINFNENASYELLKFIRKKGYEFCYISKHGRNLEEMIKIAKFDGGAGGYFYASVPSQTFEGVSHAVIVDTDLNVVHDPNPNQLALNLKPTDVEAIITLTNYVIGKTGEIYTYDEWCKLSREEQDLNTH